jgi:hypothetical protein
MLRPNSARGSNSEASGGSSTTPAVRSASGPPSPPWSSSASPRRWWRARWCTGSGRSTGSTASMPTAPPTGWRHQPRRPAAGQPGRAPDLLPPPWTGGVAVRVARRAPRRRPASGGSGARHRLPHRLRPGRPGVDVLRAGPGSGRHRRGREAVHLPPRRGARLRALHATATKGMATMPIR